MKIFKNKLLLIALLAVSYQLNAAENVMENVRTSIDSFKNYKEMNDEYNQQKIDFKDVQKDNIKLNNKFNKLFIDKDSTDQDSDLEKLQNEVNELIGKKLIEGIDNENEINNINKADNTENKKKNSINKKKKNKRKQKINKIEKIKLEYEENKRNINNFKKIMAKNQIKKLDEIINNKKDNANNVNILLQDYVIIDNIAEEKIDNNIANKEINNLKENNNQNIVEVVKENNKLINNNQKVVEENSNLDNIGINDNNKKVVKGKKRKVSKKKNAADVVLVKNGNDKKFSNPNIPNINKEKKNNSWWNFGSYIASGAKNLVSGTANVVSNISNGIKDVFWNNDEGQKNNVANEVQVNNVGNENNNVKVIKDKETKLEQNSDNNIANKSIEKNINKEEVKNIENKDITKEIEKNINEKNIINNNIEKDWNLFGNDYWYQQFGNKCVNSAWNFGKKLVENDTFRRNVIIPNAVYYGLEGAVWLSGAGLGFTLAKPALSYVVGNVVNYLIDNSKNSESNNSGVVGTYDSTDDWNVITDDINEINDVQKVKENKNFELIKTKTDTTVNKENYWKPFGSKNFLQEGMNILWNNGVTPLVINAAIKIGQPLIKNSTFGNIYDVLQPIAEQPVNYMLNNYIKNNGNKLFPNL